jgi:hypothetical protein
LTIFLLSQSAAQLTELQTGVDGAFVCEKEGENRKVAKIGAKSPLECIVGAKSPISQNVIVRQLAS